MRWGAKQLVFLVTFLGACGGQTRHGGSDDVSTSSDGGSATTGVGGSQVLPDAEPDADLDAGMDASEDVVSDYMDPGCPDAEAPPPVYECDPLAEDSGCEPGLACYPFIDRPGGGGCDFEQYGAVCVAPGAVHAGERCGQDFGWCAAGLLCVVGALPGARCLELCDPYGPDTCMGGLVCAPVDIEGYGVCG